MPELERELRALAPEWPPTPDLAPAVLARIAEEPRPLPARRRLRLPPLLVARPALAWALAVVVAAGAVLAASPDARSAILELLGLRGAKIERREPRPQVRVSPSLRLGERVTTAEALRRAEFRAQAPAGLGAPDATYFDPVRAPGGAVSFVYGRRAGIPTSRYSGAAVVVTIMQASVEPVIQKAAGPDARVESVTVDGQPGFRITGEAHGFAFVDRNGNVDFTEERLAGTTLLLERGDRLVRVEAELPAARAIAIARSAAP